MSFLNLTQEDVKVYDSVERYVGVIPFKVKAINPNKATLVQLGYPESIMEPVYKGVEILGKTFNKVSFILESLPCKTHDGKDVKPFTVKYDINLSLREDVAQSGNKKIINDHGQDTYAANVEDAVNRVTKKEGKRWFSSNGARVAMEGEVELYKFLLTYSRAKVSQQDNPSGISFEYFKDIANGDISMLGKMFGTAVFAESGIRILVGMRAVEKDNSIRYYPQLFTKLMGRIDSSSNTAIMKEANSLGYEFYKKADFGMDERIKVFTPTPVEVQKTEEKPQTGLLFG